MPPYRSRTTTHGRNMAGARGLWRATGMKDQDFGKPIIAIANSFTQFVPGHVHLKDLGQLVAREIERAGGVAKEFNTIAVDDGIAMGHDGMLYSLPSRDLIADSVEYMANAHCADALVCISNCDKITPGLSIGHVSPEAAEGGTIALVQPGDIIEIDIPERSIRLAVPEEELLARRHRMNAKGAGKWQPAATRKRAVSPALQAYAAMTTSAARGAVRSLERFGNAW